MMKLGGRCIVQKSRLSWKNVQSVRSLTVLIHRVLTNRFCTISLLYLIKWSSCYFYEFIILIITTYLCVVITEVIR